jgi:hypothetical protein
MPGRRFAKIRFCSAIAEVDIIDDSACAAIILVRGLIDNDMHALRLDSGNRPRSALHDARVPDDQRSATGLRSRLQQANGASAEHGFDLAVKAAAVAAGAAWQLKQASGQPRTFLGFHFLYVRRCCTSRQSEVGNHDDIKVTAASASSLSHSFTAFSGFACWSRSPMICRNKRSGIDWPAPAGEMVACHVFCLV